MWCNGGLERAKQKSKSCAKSWNDIKIAQSYLHLIDTNLCGHGVYRPNKKQSVISFYKWKLDEYERINKNTGKSIREKGSEFGKNVVYNEVEKYFDLKGEGRDMRRIFGPYRETKKLKALKVTNKEEYDRILSANRMEYYNIPAKNIAAEVDERIRKYENTIFSMY